MNGHMVEPGLLPIFRVAAALRVGVVVAFAGARWAAGAGPGPPTWLTLSEATLLFTYLMCPGLPRRMGRTFLPVALVIAWTGPIVAELGLFSMILPLERPGPGVEVLITVASVLPALLVPAVITAWQYGAGWALAAALGTSLIAVSALLPRLDSFTRLPVLSFILSRTWVLILVGYVVVRLAESQRSQRQALLQTNAQLVQYTVMLEQVAAARERNRLARELHDTLAHTLSGLAVQLEAAKSVWETDPDRTRGFLDAALTTTRAGLTETRRALQDLRASSLEALGLPLALRQLAESATARTGASLDLRAPDASARFPPEVEQCVYRVAQEALENVVRHADARHISVALEVHNGQVALTVRDDGRGFDMKSLTNDGGLGLRGVRERATMLGGTLEIDTRPGSHTVVRLTLRANT